MKNQNYNGAASEPDVRVVSVNSETSNEPRGRNFDQQFLGVPMVSHGQTCRNFIANVRTETLQCFHPALLAWLPLLLLRYQIGLYRYQFLIFRCWDRRSYLNSLLFGVRPNVLLSRKTDLHYQAI